MTLSSARSIRGIKLILAYRNYNGNVSHIMQLSFQAMESVRKSLKRRSARVEATGVDIDWQRAELNEAIILEAGKTLPQYVLDSLQRDAVGLKGPVTTPIAGGFQSVNVALRKTLDLFANVRPVRTLARRQDALQRRRTSTW